MRRYFAKAEAIRNGKIYITDNEDILYLSIVLRMKPGGELLVSDGVSDAYICRITEISKDGIVLSIESKQPFTESYKTRITLYQGLPKGAKMDEIVRKATELGAYRIVPVVTKRSIPNPDSVKSPAKIDRWRRIAEEAARQSRRVCIPEVAEIVNFESAAAGLEFGGYDLTLALYELEERRTLKNVLREEFGDERSGPPDVDVSDRFPGFPGIAIFVGPEGGFEEQEIDRLIQNGAKPVTIGETILRTETAGPAAVAMILYELEL